jgi:hypothetical protein
MGMYTEFVLKFSISKENDDYSKVLAILSHMTDNRVEITDKLPPHQFFNASRWDLMAKSGRSRVDACSYSDAVDVMLIGEFKNYEGELGLFIDWITPYLELDLVGFSRYEGDDHTEPYFILAE